MGRFDGKLAVVTGGARGIGKGIAELFETRGARVVTLDVQPGAHIRCDISSESDVAAAFEQVSQTLGPPAILVNNAAIEINGSIEQTTVDQWDRQMAVNLRGAFLCSRAAIPLMRGRGGAIVHISSVHAYVAYPECPAYDTTKAGLLGLTRAMALDHGKDNIRVNCICPGYIDTPLLEQWFRLSPDPAAERRRVLGYHPLGRMGTPRDIAEACLFLCSDAAAFVTGASLTVDGGMTLAGH